MNTLINAMLIGVVAAGVAHSFYIWIGSPDAEKGDYDPDMILAPIGRMLLRGYHWLNLKGVWPNPFKLLMCQYCLSVWVALGLSIAFGLPVMAVIISTFIPALVLSIIYK